MTIQQKEIARRLIVEAIKYRREAVVTHGSSKLDDAKIKAFKRYHALLLAAHYASFIVAAKIVMNPQTTTTASSVSMTFKL